MVKDNIFIPVGFFPVDSGRKRSGRLLNVLCTFNLRPVSTGLFYNL